MRSIKLGLVIFGIFFIFLSIQQGTSAQTDSPVYSSCVYPDGTGTLIYAPDELGNRIPDFSYCGYMGGGVPIPDVPVAITIEPVDGDDDENIQAAIDHVSSLPLNPDGFRGAVLLKSGTYEVRGSVRISDSGVVLRGEGDGEDGTVILGVGTEQRKLIIARGTGVPVEVEGSRVVIADEYVPVGSMSFEVADASGFTVGDNVIVLRPSIAEWISVLGMDRIPPRSDGNPVYQWEPGSKNILSDRVITAIDSNRITIDAPICCAIDGQYGGGYVYLYDYPGRISNVGIENMRGDSEYADILDEDHAWSFIEFNEIENGWARNITGVHFGFNIVAVSRWGKFITVQDCMSLEPISLVTGSRRYPFMTTGQMTLFYRCYSEFGRHDFVPQTTSAGPNVFLRCESIQAFSDTGPHQRWATGTLFDNVHVSGNAINVRNRGNMGSGHGWAGANFVLWNCSANSMIIESPPTATNWAIGCTAGVYQGDGEWESRGVAVEPESLYEAQLVERLGPDALSVLE